jgi:hypothetical protein
MTIATFWKNQVLAIKACKENDKGIINMFCGSGKTRVLVEVALSYNISLIIVPRNVLIEQHIETIKKNPNYKDFELITINCEEKDKKYKKNNKKTIYIVNNSSLNIFDNLKIVPDVVCIDEAHVSKNLVKECKAVKNCVKRYYFTATPQDMDDEEIYGKEIYKFSYLQARTCNYVCDFKIVPIISNNPEELNEEMKKRNLNHCIHYYPTVKEINNGKMCAEQANDNFKKSKLIEGTTPKEIRKEIINNWKKDGGHLISCKTISYGLDIQECDSVFISNVSDSHTEFIQQMSRAIRKFNKNPDKIAYIFVLFDDLKIQKENKDITNEIKNCKSKLAIKIGTILKQGMDIDILNKQKIYKDKKTDNELIEYKFILEEKIKQQEQEIEKLNIEIINETEIDRKYNLEQKLGILIQELNKNYYEVEQINQIKQDEENTENINKKKTLPNILDDTWFDDNNITILHENGELNGTSNKEIIVEEIAETIKEPENIIDGVNIEKLIKWFDGNALVGKMIKYLYNNECHITFKEFKQGINYEKTDKNFTNNIDNGRGIKTLHGKLWDYRKEQIILNPNIRKVIDNYFIMKKNIDMWLKKENKIGQILLYIYNNDNGTSENDFKNFLVSNDICINWYQELSRKDEQGYKYKFIFHRDENNKLSLTKEAKKYIELLL